MEMVQYNTISLLRHGFKILTKRRTLQTSTYCRFWKISSPTTLYVLQL